MGNGGERQSLRPPVVSACRSTCKASRHHSLRIGAVTRQNSCGASVAFWADGPSYTRRQRRPTRRGLVKANGPPSNSSKLYLITRGNDTCPSQGTTLREGAELSVLKGRPLAPKRFWHQTVGAEKVLAVLAASPCHGNGPAPRAVGPGPGRAAGWATADGAQGMAPPHQIPSWGAL